MSDPQTAFANPFRPSFGQQPPVLSGRDGFLDAVAGDLAAGPASPGYTSLLLGARGMGKTTVLHKVCENAETDGWVICRVEAQFGARQGDLTHLALAQTARDRLSELLPKRRAARLSGMSIGPVSLSWRRDDDDPAPPRTREMQRALDDLAEACVSKRRAGVLLAVDEFHNLRAADASVIASAIQMLTKAGSKPVALFGAGLPHLEQTLLPNKGFTFFQRTVKRRLEGLSCSEAMQALSKPFASAGIAAEESLMQTAAQTTKGYPYAVQSLGHHLWKEAVGGGRVEEEHLERAVLSMRADVTENVTVPIWGRLPGRARDFLAAMSADTGPSRVSDLAERMNASPSLVNNYRRRLISEGVIAATGHGLVSYVDPHLVELAADHALDMEMLRAGEGPAG